MDYRRIASDVLLHYRRLRAGVRKQQEFWVDYGNRQDKRITALERQLAEQDKKLFESDLDRKRLEAKERSDG